MYDILILGGGPAGLSAAVAARQKNRTALVIGNSSASNPLWRAERIDNYPGLPGVTGAQLLEQFERHARDMGVEFVTGRAISAMAMGEESFFLTVGNAVYEGRKLILAAGVTRGAKYPGEQEYLGRGVSYCATCDGMLYRNRPVVVVGRSKDAPLEANYLASLGCQVTYVSPQAPGALDERIPFIRANRLEITGEDTVTALMADGAKLPCDAVFVLRESVAPTELFPELATEKGTVVVDRQMRTNLPGVFAAGDCTGKPLQIAKAVGEGLIAAECAADELSESERK